MRLDNFALAGFVAALIVWSIVLVELLEVAF